MLIIVEGALAFHALANETEPELADLHQVSGHLESQRTVEEGTGTTDYGYGEKELLEPIKVADKKIVRDFALFSYSHLCNDIINGGGHYLQTLYSLLGIAEESRKTMLKDLMAILMQEERVAEFAMKLADYKIRKHD